MKYQHLLMSTKLVVIGSLLVGCSTGNSAQPKQMHSQSVHAGSGYTDAIKAVMMAPDITKNAYACEWPDEYPGSDEPGAAYKESQAAAEDADCHEDQEE